LRLEEFLKESSTADVSKVLSAVAKSSVRVWEALPTERGVTGGTNPSGDRQAALDVFTNEEFSNSLMATGAVAELASEEAAQTASKSMDFSQRAYVVAEVVLFAPPKAGEKLHLRARIVNNGKTPALELTSNTRLTLVPIDITVQSAHDAAFSMKDKTLTSKTTLGSGQQIEQLADSLNELTEAEITQINAARLRPYIFVYVSYRDLFGHQRKIEMCQYYDPNFKLMMTCDAFNNAE